MDLVLSKVNDTIEANRRKSVI